MAGRCNMITIEQIDEFRKRTNSSYEDAKYFLEKNDGDILDAIIDFERTKQAGSSKREHKKNKDDFEMKIADLIQKGFDTRIVIHDKDSKLFTFPIILLVLLIPLGVLAVLFFVLLIMIGYKVTIENIKNESVNVHSIFRDISEKTNSKVGSKEHKHKRHQSAGNNQRYSNNKDTNTNQNAGNNQGTQSNQNPGNSQYADTNREASANQNPDAGKKNDYNLVPVQTNITKATETASSKPEDEEDKEEGFNEYTVE